MPATNSPLSHVDPSCPFCAIATAFPPTAPSSTFDSQSSTSTSTDSTSDAASESDPLHPERTFPPSYVILSTPDVIAFFDIAPLTRGHILLATRRHRVKTVDLTTAEGAELGRVFPLIARSVLRAVFPGSDPSEADYNFVQNNGPLAAQVIPHVHFHLIPRPPPPTTLTTSPTSTSSFSSTSFAQQSWLSFGRGARTELDDDDAAVLVRQIRDGVKREVERVRVDEGVDLEAIWGWSASRTSSPGGGIGGAGAVSGGGRAGGSSSQNAVRNKEKL